MVKLTLKQVRLQKNLKWDPRQIARKKCCPCGKPEGTLDLVVTHASLGGDARRWHGVPALLPAQTPNRAERALIP